MDKIAPGRQAQIRTGSVTEFVGTTVMRIALDEAACKIRSGGPNDDADDMGVAAWAGVLPFVRQHGAPIADVNCTQDTPDYVRHWQSQI